MILAEIAITRFPSSDMSVGQSGTIRLFCCWCLLSSKATSAPCGSPSQGAIDGAVTLKPSNDAFWVDCLSA